MMKTLRLIGYVSLFTLISVNAFSQSISKREIKYDRKGDLYCTIRVVNPTYKRIVCVVVQTQFEKTVWDKYTMRPVYPLISYKLTDANIPPKCYSDCDFYPDQNYGKPTKIKLKRVIFSDGTSLLSR